MENKSRTTGGLEQSPGWSDWWAEYHLHLREHEALSELHRFELSCRRACHGRTCDAHTFLGVGSALPMIEVTAK